MLSVKFDGFELSDYLKVTSDFNRGVGSNRNLNMQKLGETRGKEFLSTTNDEGSFSMPFVLRYDLINKRRELAKILDVKEPKKLIFGDEPDKYYMAIPDGDIDVDEIYFLGKGEITWIIPDAAAHSSVIKSFTATENDEGILEFDIQNEGSESVPITYRIANSKDNGYIGIVSEHGAMQFGKIDEADGEDYQRNEQLISTKDFSSFTNFTGTNPQDSNKAVNGTLAQGTVEGFPVLRLSNAGSGGGWHGGMKMIDIPEDSEGHVGAKNFYCFFDSWFETGLMGQTGCVNISFFTADNKLICSYIIEKVDASGNAARVLFQIGGENPAVYRNNAFTSSNVTAENPFKSTEGKADVIKEGGTVKLFWRGQRFNATAPDLADVECARIGVYIGQLGTRNITTQFVTRCYLRELVFQKLNVDKWRDTPNRYPANSEVVVNGDETKLYANGLVALDDEIKGTQYFKAPPGETRVQLYASDFTEIESAVAEIREAWI
ncbi:distal tail protein Dit [Enterococcus larvae]|uniref:distal tail protein Dit n=1 Tax=Enterococcus larvae TaxID=2794352 RepID=UPI003F2FA641